MIKINDHEYSNPYDKSNDNNKTAGCVCGNKNINNRNHKNVHNILTDNNSNNNNQ